MRLFKHKSFTPSFLQLNVYLLTSILFILTVQCECGTVPVVEPEEKVDESFIEKVSNDYLKDVLRALQQGKQVNLAQTDGSDTDRTPFLLAIMEPEHTVSILRYLLKKGKGDVNTGNSYGATALHWAVNKQHYKSDVVTFLLDQGANINIQDNYQRPPIEATIFSDNLPALQLLIEKGADINIICDEQENRPLHLAAEKKNEAMVQYLLLKKADKNQPNKASKLPIDCADSNITIRNLLT